MINRILNLMEQKMKRILVIRNDKIGDFMLAWPAFAMLKQSMPEAEITALVPNYTKALAELCPYIDNVLVDCGKKASKEDKRALVKQIKNIGFDASICLFSDSYNAKLVWRSRIPARFAPATKLSQFLYNHRIVQRRSQSAKPEFEYNLDLVRTFLTHEKANIVEPSAPYYRFRTKQLNEQKNKLVAALNLDDSKPWLFIHAGSGGSANNLSLAQYADLIERVNADRTFELVLTAGPGEEQQTGQLQSLLQAKGLAAALYDKNDGLVDFTCSIACASGFIAGSTGPLHIAAALDVPTVGFFPAKRSATPLRWQPINAQGRHLAFAPPANEDKAIASDMGQIQVADIAPNISQFLTRLLPEAQAE